MLTRRQLAATILTAAATGPATAAAADSTNELQAARDQNRRSAEALAKFAVPMETEPAFHFSA